MKAMGKATISNNVRKVSSGFDIPSKEYRKVYNKIHKLFFIGSSSNNILYRNWLSHQGIKLSDRYEQRKLREGKGKKNLVYSGTLYKAIISKNKNRKVVISAKKRKNKTMSIRFHNLPGKYDKILQNGTLKGFLRNGKAFANADEAKALKTGQTGRFNLGLKIKQSIFKRSKNNSIQRISGRAFPIVIPMPEDNNIIMPVMREEIDKLLKKEVNS